MPKISVIVPVYNVEKYLNQCIDSLLDQTFTDYEVICIDDGSTDDCGRILDAYAKQDCRLRVVHKPNSGYGKSMNVGLQLAKGEYIAIVESDDFVEEDMLENLYHAAVTSEADVIRGRYFRHTGGEDISAGYYDGIPINQKISIVSCPMLFCIAETIWTGLYRRKYLEENHIRFHETEGASFQDISFALQCWLCGGTAFFIDETVIHYRIDNPGSSMKNPSKIFCVFDEYGWIEGLFADFLKSNPELDKYLVAMKYRDYLNHYFRVGSQYQYALLVRLQENFQEDEHAGRIEPTAFLPRVWEYIQKIQENRNSFFAGTTKDRHDDRLAYCHTKNEAVYQEAFVGRLKGYQGVIIYGAGIVGQRLAGALLYNNITEIIFGVTSVTDNPQTCMEYPVKAISDLVYLSKKYAVVLAATEGKQYEMYRNSERLGFEYIFRVDDTVKKWMDESK